MTFRRRNDAVVWGYAVLVGLVLLLTSLSGVEVGQVAPALASLAVLALPVALLSRLSLRVDATGFSVWLGPGLFRRTCPRAAIVSIQAAAAPSPFGVGLRLVPGGWLYSLGGRDFAEIRFVDGSRLLIGHGNDPGLLRGLEVLAGRG